MSSPMGESVVQDVVIKMKRQEIETQSVHLNDDRGRVVIIVTSLFTLFAIITTLARLITRRAIVKVPWQPDDYAIAAATLFAIGLYVEAVLCVHFGTGKHLLTLRVDGITFAMEITFNLCQLAIKASLLLLYKAVLTLENRRFRIAWRAAALYVVTLYITTILATLFQCTPFHYGWDRFYGKGRGHCVNLKAQSISTAVLSTLSDVSLLILPIPILWGLQMPWKRKLGLSCIFLLGGFACVASIIRIVFISKVGSDMDFTYVTVDPLNWSIIEPCVGIVCACLSTLRPLYRFLFHRSSTDARKWPQCSFAQFLPGICREKVQSRSKIGSDEDEKYASRKWLSNLIRQERNGSADEETIGTPSPGSAVNAVEMGRFGGFGEADEELAGHQVRPML